MPDGLSEAERYPWLTADAREQLRALHESAHAPRFNHQCGDRLSAAGLARVRAYAQLLASEPPGWAPGRQPAWLAEFAARCHATVPFYRQYGAPPATFADTPTCDRADLSHAPWAFVPDDAALDDLIVYNTSGATGHPLDILSHPEASACYLPLLRAALATRGVELLGGRDPATGRLRVALVLACFQRRTYTYAAVLSFLGGAGFVKINLNTDDWRDPADRARYLDECQPEVLTGDPLSFAELARLEMQHRPKALISTAMALTPGLCAELEARWGCPVIDLYAMNEAGPIAALTPTGYAPLQPRLYFEVLDAEGRPCPLGERGEVTLTGGFNPFLPLLRYRTGDYARLAHVGGQPRLVELEGRAPVVFTGAAGQAINNIDVSGALKRFALPQYQLHQAADGALTLTARKSSAPLEKVRAALLGLFGAEQVVSMAESDPAAAPDGKVRQYTREAA
ncbi:MAG: AMP-binding protein [Anaerolineales bacterium]|nr:AMP-binding protein [Anaerolineales bacterium]